MENLVTAPTGFWQHKRVFVTGSTGLVGSWLIKRLLKLDANVVALVRDCDSHSELVRSGAIQQIAVVNGALENQSDLHRAVCEYEIDTIFHLGAQTIVGAAYRNPRGTFEANIQGTWNLLETCRAQSDLVQRIVVASSDKAYGTGETLPYTECMPTRGRFPYDVSKSCADLIAQSYYHTYGLPVVIARCGNIYGGGDLNWSRIVPSAIRSLYHGDRPVMRSDGTFTRDYVYVEDAVTAYLSMAESLGRDEVKGQAFNFGPARPTCVREIVDAVRAIMNRQDLEPVVLDTARAEIRDQFLSSEKAHKVLGWTPRYSLHEGLTQSIEWYREFFRSAA